MTSAYSQTGGVNQSVEFGDSSSIGAFNRLRVAEVLSLNISKFEYSKDIHSWPELATGVGTATHLPDEAANLLEVGATANDKITKQSKCYSQYQPGNSQLGMFSGVFGDFETGISKRCGYFDDDNGIIFEQDGVNDVYNIILRSSTSGSPVDTKITQADWQVDIFQLQDKEDITTKNTNPSKKRINFTKSFIFFIDLEWLGVGRVRGGFVQDGIIYYAHEFLNAGSTDKVYMATASLPIRYEVENISGTNTGSMKQICSTIKSEGGQQIFGVPHVAARSFYEVKTVLDTSGAGDGSYTPILSIRPRKLFHSKDFRGVIRPVEFEFFVEGNFPIEFILVHDGDLVKGGATPVPLVDGDWTPVADETKDVPSATEYTLVATGVDETTGHIHNFGFADAAVKGVPTIGEDVQTVIELCNGIDINDRAETDTYTLAARSKGGSPTVSAVLRVTEIR
jgi:hypothetical protein